MFTKFFGYLGCGLAISVSFLGYSNAKNAATGKGGIGVSADLLSLPPAPLSTYLALRRYLTVYLAPCMKHFSIYLLVSLDTNREYFG